MPPWVGLVMIAIVGVPFMVAGMIIGSLLTLFVIYRRQILEEAKRIRARFAHARRGGIG